MALLRSIEHFNPYIERLGQYFQANRIVGEENIAKRRPTFLSVVGPGPYKLLQSILALVKPSEKTPHQWDGIKHITSVLYHPVTNGMTKRAV